METDISLDEIVSAVPSPSREAWRILVVDDCQDILQLLRLSLDHAGYRVDVVDSLAGARKKLANGDYDLVICDVCMPEGSGLDLLHELAPSAPDIAVIMMTGHADMDLAIDSLREGAFDFIPKPFRLDKLLKVTERAQARQQRLVAQKQLMERRLETMARFTEDVHNPVFQIADGGKILYANQASGYLLKQWETTEKADRIPAPLLEMATRKFAGQPVADQAFTFGGKTYSFNVTEPVNGELVYLYGYDMTDLKAAQQDLLKLKNEALRLARTDHLTGLPNRLSFAGAISRLEKPSEGTVTAVVMTDVNKFKQINDNFGHDTGDRILVTIGNSIQRQLRPDDMIFRWGGDEILLILVQMESREAVDRFLKELNANVAKDVGSQLPFDVSLGIGWAYWPDDGEDIEQVLIKADDALFRNKAASISCWHANHECDSAGDDQSDEELFTQLSTAVEGKEIEVQFQPIIDSAVNRSISVEALARWNTRAGAVSPARFIPLADSRGLAPSLGDLIVAKSLRFLSVLRAEGFEVDISINLSQWQLQESAFSDNLLEMVNSLQLKPDWVCLEISEKYPLFNNSLYCNRIVGLQTAGFQIALDDFGTGFSTLQALADLPVNRIKLDRSLTQRCGTAKGDRILASMAELTKSLNLQLVAEGVETEQQMQYLRELGIFIFQGFYFKPPAAAPSLLQYLKETRKTLAPR